MLVYRPSRRADFLRVLWLAGTIIFLHFMFVEIAGYPLTIAPFAVIMFMLLAYRFQFPKLTVVLWSLLLTLPFLNLVLPGVPIDFVEFMKTYLLWCFAGTVILFALKARPRSHSRWIGRAAFISLVILALYSVAQVMLYQYLSLAVLYNPFGEYQYLYQYDVLLHSENIRAPGFYLEPSFNAFIVTSLFFITLIDGYRPTASLVLSGVALLAIKALSGILIFGFILLGYLALRGTRKQLGAGAAICVSAIIVVGMSSVGEYVWQRITNISAEGTSTYYRLVAPLEIVRDILMDHFTGLPFGTTERVLLDYGLLLGNKPGSSLDNGFYLLIYYFGWIGIIIVILAAMIGLLSGRSKAEGSTLYLLGYLFLSLFYSGGIFAPEYVFIIILVIYVWRANRESEYEATYKTKFTPAPGYMKASVAERSR